MCHKIILINILYVIFYDSFSPTFLYQCSLWHIGYLLQFKNLSLIKKKTRTAKRREQLTNMWACMLGYPWTYDTSIVIWDYTAHLWNFDSWIIVPKIKRKNSQVRRLIRVPQFPTTISSGRSNMLPERNSISSGQIIIWSRQINMSSERIIIPYKQRIVIPCLTHK